MQKVQKPGGSSCVNVINNERYIQTSGSPVGLCRLSARLRRLKLSDLQVSMLHFWTERSAFQGPLNLKP